MISSRDRRVRTTPERDKPSHAQGGLSLNDGREKGERRLGGSESLWRRSPAIPPVRAGLSRLRAKRAPYLLAYRGKGAV